MNLDPAHRQPGLVDVVPRVAGGAARSRDARRTPTTSWPARGERARQSLRRERAARREIRREVRRDHRDPHCVFKPTSATYACPVMATVSELADARELFRNLTLRELRGKYKRSALGWAWSLVNPLATMGIFTVVFKVVLRISTRRGDPCGLRELRRSSCSAACCPWNFLATGLTGGMSAPLANANLIKKVYFPREVLAASVVAAWAVQFAIELVVLARGAAVRRQLRASRGSRASLLVLGDPDGVRLRARRWRSAC